MPSVTTFIAGKAVDGDRPIAKQNQDRLGFAVVAEHLARAIVDQPATDGFVVGIEGRWGSGKSSLINLTIEALRNRDASAPEIISFSPWLVGNREELLRNLFDELAAVAVKIDPIEPTASEVAISTTWWQHVKKWISHDAYWRLKRKEQLKEQLGGRLGAFGAVAGGLSKITKVAAFFGVPAANWLGEAIGGSGQAASELAKERSVSRRKSELVAALRLLSRRIVIFVDDLDRLEPREASEVLRLIRAVADFPNLIYVLSYDPAVVAQTLTNAIQVLDGTEFLEKIVQVSFRVPRPEAFDLRRWFQVEVDKLFPSDAVGSSEGLIRRRLAQIIDTQGGRYLQTPRDVARALNALRLHAVPVRSQIDISDMVWLQLVRIGNPDLYLWAEEYLTEVAAITNGATVSQEAAVESGARLVALLTNEGLNVDLAIIELGSILPGLSGHTSFERGEERRRRVFNDLRGDTIHRFVAAKRLGSPQHYRYYFAFSEPAGALRDDQVSEFIAACAEGPNEATEAFIKLATEVRPQGGTMAEVLVDRLISVADRTPESAILNILASLANSLDVLAASSSTTDFSESRIWISAERLVSLLLERVTGDSRALSLRILFTEGRAMGWLTRLLRNEIFAHGHFGDRAEPEDQRLLTTTEFQSVLATMLGRYRETPPAELLRAPNFLSLLYAWQQGAQNDEARNWAQMQTATDSGLLAFLARVRGWAAADEVYYPLNRRDLVNFLDYDDVVRRVAALAANTDAPQTDRQLASELMIAIEQGARR